MLSVDMLIIVMLGVVASNAETFYNIRQNMFVMGLFLSNVLGLLHKTVYRRNLFPTIVS
jgi:hypothetical protein